MGLMGGWEGVLSLRMGLAQHTHIHSSHTPRITWWLCGCSLCMGAFLLLSHCPLGGNRKVRIRGNFCWRC